MLLLLLPLPKKTNGSQPATVEEEHTAVVLATMRLPSLLSRVSDGFLSLRGSPDELWKAYALKFLDSYSYFSFSIVFTLFLTDDFGYTDVEAGTIYGLWGALITVYGLLTGPLIDRLGVSWSLRAGFATSLAARVLLFVTTSRPVLIATTCMLLPLGNCMGIPVLTTGIRRYTNERNRGFAFGIFYCVMNVAALCSGPVVDACTIWLKPHRDGLDELQQQQDQQQSGQNDNSAGAVIVTPSSQPWTITGYRLVILTGIVSNVIACLVTFTVREIKVHERKDSDEKITPPSNGNGSDGADEGVSTFTPVKTNAIQILRETTTTKRFWRFLAVCMITLNVRMIFRHLDATLPKYMVREFGPNVAKGTIYSINPVIIIALVPIVTAATSDVDPLVMIHVGSYISAGSVFFLAMSTSIWACIAFVTVLSIGEAIWSPRLYDYTVSVVKEGHEGTYMALSSAPLFLAKLPVGFMSGQLLQKYCPAGEGQQRRSRQMWFIIGATTAISPILMTLCWKYISHKDSKDDRVDLSRQPTAIHSKEEAIFGLHDGKQSEPLALTDISERDGEFLPLKKEISLPPVRPSTAIGP